MDDEMPDEIDFSGAVRGKYLPRYQGWRGVTYAAGSPAIIRVTTWNACSAKIERPTE